MSARAPATVGPAILAGLIPIRAVVFDLFDTLVDLVSEDMPLTEHAGRMIPATLVRLHALTADYGSVDLDDFLSVMRENEKRFLETHYAKHIELSTTERFTALVRSLEMDDPDLVALLVNTHMAGLREHVRVLDHHPDVLSQLKSRVRLGVCSNFSHVPTAEEVLEASHLADLFDTVVISEAAGFRKPHPEIFRATLAGLGVEEHEVLHVGDSLKADVAGAADLGIPTVWITRRIKEPEKALSGYSGPRPDFQIEDLSELDGLLRQME